MMESPEFSSLSSLRGEFKSEDYIQPHYKESYRLAIDRLVKGGRDSYHEFLKGERVGSFLSEEELLFIKTRAEHPPPQHHNEEINDPPDSQSSSGTYWPVHSDVDTPDLELGWPDVMHEKPQTNIDLLFHPPRQNNPTIKEVIRKHIQDARQVIAIVMDKFTDVDIFKETVDASIRGVPVYVLLADSHWKSFLTMAETQDVKIQQLRNMRVRTVKGQDYFCRSGAKFHGAVEQKFLLVDCHTAIYGSYSFTWSFEKINLSMVQVITGLLVMSYDEEFRTLYARSTVPAELCPVESLFQSNGSHGCPILPNFVSRSVLQLDRRKQLRDTLDTVYQKNCERKLGARDLEERLFEEEFKEVRSVVQNGIGVRNQMPKFQSAEMTNFLKRHSYAGERKEGCVPQDIRIRASNWNISREMGNGTNNYSKDNYLHVPQIYRGQNVYRSYNGNDMQLSMQQTTPTLENTSKSFMRNMRIESYLKNPDIPLGNSCDYLDQFEPLDKANTFMQGRMRSSLVFRSTIPEQMEPNIHINNTSTGVRAPAAPHSPLHNSSMQWSPNAAAESWITNDKSMLKQQSLQMLDNAWNHTSYGPGRKSYHPEYASLGRAKAMQMISNPDILTDTWHKRHSVADPRSNTEYALVSSSHMYGAFARTQVNRSTAGINIQTGGHASNLIDDQRSVSHYDVKSITDKKGPTSPDWQEPLCRTVSAAALDVNSRDLSVKYSPGSHRFLKKSSKKIKSLFNVLEKKEDSIRTMETPSLKSEGSTDTITAEDERILNRGGKGHQSTTISVRSSLEHQVNRSVDDPKYSKPRFRTEEHQPPPQTYLRKPAAADKSARPGLDTGSWSKGKGAQNRLYSRFEPFCSFEERNSLRLANTSRSQEKTQSRTKGEEAAEHNPTCPAKGHHENKLEKFIQRVGNLIHKNK